MLAYYWRLKRKYVTARKLARKTEPTYPTCIIFGSGPSLDLLNPSADFLDNKDLIGCNFIHLHNSLSKKIFKVFSVIDRDYTRALTDEYFNSLSTESFIISTKNIDLLEYKYLKRRNTVVVKTTPFNNSAHPPAKKISTGKVILTGNSLPFLIQYAAFVMGYKEIYLFGVDHFAMQDQNEDDRKNYDGYKGRTLKDLDLHQEKLEYINQFYCFIADLCAQENVRVVNATPNTKLDAFEKVNIPSLLLE